MRMSGNADENLAKALSLAEKAAKKGAKIVCLPELFRTRYFPQRRRGRSTPFCESVPGESTRAFAALAGGSRRGDAAPARIVHAMVENPEYVAGNERLCTDLMRVARGRIFAKVGAEGVYCAGIPGAELGIALKVEDGATRASEPALIAVLKSLALLTDEEVAQLERYVEPDITNTREERVGSVRASIELEPAG